MTRWIRWRRASCATLVALAALGLNALLPIHLALDLGEAFAAAHRRTPGATPHGLEWRLWACVAGHDAGDGKPGGDRHGPACPAFGALGAGGGFAAVAAAALPVPAAVAASPGLAPTAGEPGRSAAVAYRSRAPPLGGTLDTVKTAGAPSGGAGIPVRCGSAGMRCVARRVATLAVAVVGAGNSAALAHGFAGDRFFPATILTDDPFVAAEASLPTIDFGPTQGDGSRQVDIGGDLSLLITPRWDVTIGADWAHIRMPGIGAQTGFTGLTTGMQYQLFIDAEHEALALAALNVSWGNTGNPAVGAPAFTTLSPSFNFGKGFGDLPAALLWLRPFALTGNLGLDFPTAAETEGMPNPNNISYGFAVEYSIPYLQSEVRDLGWRAPFNRLIPLVEFALTTPFDRGRTGMTTGTVQPGVIWAGQYLQLGAEMIIPTNSLSGHGIGGVFQLHFYLDDLFPHGIGRPLSQW